jgi:CDP-paratose 2-epimerase
MAYLITGGCGFLGCNIAAAILQTPEKLIVLDNLSRLGGSENLAWLRTLGNFEFIHGDTRFPDDVERVVRREEIHAIFHLAGQVAMTTSLESPRKDFETNVLGSINVLEAVRQWSPETAVVYASSNKVYGDLEELPLVETPTRYELPEGRPGIDESCLLSFHSPYGCSKGAADQYMLDYARNYGLRTVVFRHSTIYGGRQFSTIDQGWVGWFCRQALELHADPARPPFTICGDGKQVRDLLHVSDAVQCYLAAAERARSVAGQAFNIGGGVSNSMSLLELFRFLEEREGVKMIYQRLPWRASDQKYFVADHAKATRLLGWAPRVSKDAGVSSALEWERSRAQGNRNATGI